MDKDTCLFYEGEFYKVEWYFDDKGFSQAYEYFLKASAVQKRKFLILVKNLPTLVPFTIKPSSGMRATI